MKKSDGTTDWVSIIMWIAIVVFVVWGIYKWGVDNTKRSLVPQTPQEMREAKANCYKWYGKEACDNGSYDSY